MLNCNIKKIQSEFNVKIKNNIIDYSKLDNKKEFEDYIERYNDDLGVKVFHLMPDNTVNIDSNTLRKVSDDIKREEKYKLVNELNGLPTDVFFAPRFVDDKIKFSKLKQEKQLIKFWRFNIGGIVYKLGLTADRYRKRGEIKKAIEVEKQKEYFKTLKESKTAELAENIIFELNALKQLVDKVKDNSDTSYLEDTELLNRINTLSKLILAEYDGIPYAKVEDSYIPKDNEDIKQLIFLHDVLKEIVGDINMKDFIKQLEDIKNSLEIAKKEYLKNVIKNDPTIKLNLKDNKWTEKDVNKVLEMIENNEISLSWRELNTLGIGHAGIIGQVLNGLRSKFFLKERGAFAKELDLLLKSWNNIKNERYKGKRIANYFFEKDSDGVKTGKLENIFTKEYEKSLSEYLRIKVRNYERGNTSMLKEEEVNRGLSRLDYRKVKEIYDKYHNHPVYGKYFIFSEEEVDVYTNKIKDRLGEGYYAYVVRQAFDMIEDYNIFRHTTIEEISHQKNPFVFLENYFEHDIITPEQEDDYSLIIPANSSVFNNKLKEILDNNKDAADFYFSTYKFLTEYVNPTYIAEGADIDLLQLPGDIDVTFNEVLKQKGFFGAITESMKNILHNYESFFAKKIDKKSRFSQISIYNNKRKAKKIKEIADKKGLSIKKEEIEQEANRYLDDNLFLAIKNGIFAAADIRTRRSLVGVTELFIEHSKDNSKLHERLKQHYEQNVLGQNLTELKIGGKERKYFGKILLTPLWKSYDRMDKYLLKQFEQFKKNFKSGKKGASLNAFGGNTVYNPENGKFEVYDNKGKLIRQVSDKEINKELKRLKKELKEELGTPITLASMWLGLMQIVNYKYLAFNIKGGVSNLLYGYVQTRTVATSGRFGFNEKDYDDSRRFLFGYNTRRYLGLFIDKFKKDSKGRKFKTLELLIGSLDLIQNRADELAAQGRFSDKDLSSYGKSFKDFIFDFHINNPEFHNQMGVLLSVAKNIYVEVHPAYAEHYKDGKYPLFDGKDFIYIPGTLKLKPEFRTPKNIEMWEDFKEASDGSIDSIAFYTKAIAAIHATQGNYSNWDLVPLQNSVIGKSSLFYNRYLPENFDLNWGNKEVNIVTGTFGMKGRKLNLFEHAPTLALYYATSSFGGLMASIAKGMALSTVNPLLGAAYAGKKVLQTAPLIYLTAKSIINSELKFSAEELKLAYSFFVETVKRIVDVPVELMTMQKINVFRESIKKQQLGDVENLSLTEQERKILSEASQELAIKLSTYLTLTATAYALKALLIHFDMQYKPCDDDIVNDDCKERNKAYLEKLKSFDGIVNFILNFRNQVMGDFEKYENPYNSASSMTDKSAAISLLISMQRSMKRLDDITQGVITGDTDKVIDKSLDFIKYNPYIPIPTIFVKTTQGRHPFQDSRVWEGTTTFEKNLLYDRFLPKNILYKKLVKQKRDGKFKKEVSEYFKDDIDEIFYDYNEKEKEKVSELLYTKFFRKKPDESYVKQYKYMDLEKLDSILKNNGGKKIIVEYIRFIQDYKQIPPKKRTKALKKAYTRINRYLRVLAEKIREVE